MTTIIPIAVEKELSSSYLSYAMSVIVNRAIPDVRDGLKPVHRRILFSMYESGFLWNKPYRKASRVVGEVMGKYHPHGDLAIYDALVRLAQEFSLLLPLLDGQGNFGSIDGDPPAAMRYTEVRLALSAKWLLEDIYEDTVNFQPNYDGLEKEPLVLPARFPNILVNGISGVAVGMATNIPPHNLAEVIDACQAYIINPDLSLEEWINLIPAPDFPTGGTIIGNQGIRNAFSTGKGSIIIRGKTHLEDFSNNKRALIIDELPYQVNKARLIEHIALLVREKKIELISDIRDESDKSGIRVVIELKKGGNPDLLLNQLLNLTALQTSFGINMMLLDKMKPSLMPLKEIIIAFIQHRKDVVLRRTKFRLERARQRANVLSALYVAILNIDAIVALIRSASSTSAAVLKLLETEWSIDHALGSVIGIITGADFKGSSYFLTKLQAEAILEMKLSRLTGLEKDKLLSELDNLIQEIKNALAILTSPQLLMELISKELNEIKEKFGAPRKTIIESQQNVGNLDDESLIPVEDVVVTVTSAGYIKRVKLEFYKSQKRGGKGKIGQIVKEEDFTIDAFVASTHTNLLFFSDKGRVYRLKVYKLPAAEPQARGRALVNLLNLSEGEQINSVMPIYNADEDNFIIFSTARGNVRRNTLADFDYIPTVGKIAISLDEGDKLISVQLCKVSEDIALVTKEGKSIRFPSQDIRLFKSRNSVGVRGIKLKSSDEVIAMFILHHLKLTLEEREQYLRIPVKERLNLLGTEAELITPDIKISLELLKEYASQEQFILTVTENGYGKMTSSYEYRQTGRGGSGITNILTSRRNGKVAAAFTAPYDDEIIIVTNKGQLIRMPLKEVPVIGRATQGVSLLKVKSGEKVVSIAKIAEQPLLS